MNKEQTQKMIEVMQAYVDGQFIQFYNNGSKQWVNVNDPCWGWGDFDYRIAPTLYHPKDLPENRLAKIVKHSDTYYLDRIVLRHGDYLLLVGKGKANWFGGLDEYTDRFACQLIDGPVTITSYV
jgi:hypothetical protein